MTAKLNVNIDHVATIREARKTIEPSIITAAVICEQAGADGITVHIRQDRRHIQDRDISHFARSRDDLFERRNGDERRDD